VPVAQIVVFIGRTTGEYDILPAVWRAVPRRRSSTPAHSGGIERTQAQARYAEPAPRLGSLPPGARGVPYGGGSAAEGERDSGACDGVEAALGVEAAGAVGTARLSTYFGTQRLMAMR
jgi:hypothetical protein